MTKNPGKHYHWDAPGGGGWTSIDQTLKDHFELDLEKDFLRSQDSEASIPERHVRLVGILFARPESELGKKLIPHFGYFHARSGRSSSFFCPGYISSPGGRKPLVTVNHKGWDFSNEVFNAMREAAEARANWKYSGATDLILVNGRYEKDSGAFLDFSSGLAVNLERLEKEGAFEVPEMFLERIFRFAETHDVDNPTWGFSDSEGTTLVGAALKGLLLQALPEGIRTEAKKAFYLAVKDFRS